MGPLVLELLEELEEREQNIKHKEKKEDYKRAFIFKVLFKDVGGFSGKHSHYKKYVCPCTYKFHAAHVILENSNIWKEGSSFSVSKN